MSFVVKQSSLLLDEFLADLVREIIQMQQSKGIKASGFSAEKLEAQVMETARTIRGQIVDNSGYFYYQEKGRKRGEAPPFGAIYTWLRFKKYGFEWADKKERISMAFKILKTIAKYGTKPARDNRPTGVLSEVITSATLDEFVSKISDSLIKEVSSAIDLDRYAIL